MGRIIRGVLNLIGVAILAALLGSLAGALHPVGDSLAVFRSVLVIGGLVYAALLWLLASRRLSSVVAAVAAGLGLPIALQSVLPLSPPAGETLTLYQKNLNFELLDPAPLLADIAEAAPDLITLQEVTEAAEESVLGALPEGYDTRTCPFSGVGAVAVASRLPIVDAVCDEGSGLVAIRVAGPEGPFWAASVHLHWPFPFNQASQAAALADRLGRLEGPVVVGGDFNMAPWSHAVGQMTRATATRALGPTLGTRPLAVPLPEIPGLPADLGLAVEVPIDHVLAAGPGQVTYRGRFGSDHEGVLAVFVP